MKKLFWLLLLVQTFFGATAQTPLFKAFDLRFNYSGNTVKIIDTDADGFIWFGAAQHLIKTDGVNFSVYDCSIKTTGDVSAIFCDASKTIWVGYANGTIAFLRNDSVVACSFAEGCPKKSITGIAQDKGGLLWFTTKGEGAYYVFNNRLYNFDSEKDGLSDDYVYVATPDDAGNMWLGTDQGVTICKVANGKKQIIKKISSSDGLPDDIVRYIATGVKGIMHLGFEDKGTCGYDVSTGKIITDTKYANWNYGPVNKIIYSQGKLWIATGTHGLIVDDLTALPLEKISSYSNLNFEKIHSITSDNENNIWLAAEKGVFVSTGKKLQIINRFNGKELTNVHVILNDVKKNLWFTPHQGLMRYTTTNENALFKVSDNDLATDIISLYEDACGYMWVGTAGKGLYRVNSATGKSTRVFNDDAFNATSILCLAGDGDYLWVSTLGGVKKIAIKDCDGDEIKTTFENFDPQNLIGNYYIYSVLVDSKKRVWFGTDGKGLIKLENNAFTTYGLKDGIKSDVIYSIAEDRNGKIWINTLNAGLYAYDGNTFKNISIENGLTDANISSIICDDNNKIIATHGNGIDIIDATSHEIIYYGKEFDLAGINPQPNAICKNKNGTIFIGCEKGILIYESPLHKNLKTPKAQITSVAVFPFTSNFNSQHEFNYNQDNLTLSFTSLWYSDAERLQFRYKLEGYSNQWNTTRDRKVNFPNLPPGSYSFRVAASLNDDFATAKETTYSFTIQKPFWKEYWFMALISLAIAFAFFYYLKSREKNLKRMENLKKEKIRFQFETLRNQVNPHFLFNSFNTLISIIEEDKDGAVEYVEKLSDFFRNIVTYKDRDVIPLADELKTASTYFYLQQKRYGKNLSLTLMVEEEAKQKKIPPMALQLLIENSVKHNAVSRETPLHIKIASTNSHLEVSNNINPKRNVEQSTGTGLLNISSRYKLLSADEIKIHNDNKIFSVSLPLID